MGHDGIAIGELSGRTGCNIETIRYYERIGLLPSPERRGRYRSYTAVDVRRLTFVRPDTAPVPRGQMRRADVPHRARKLGFTLDEVRALLALSATNGDVRARIADLRVMERLLAAAIRQCNAEKQLVCPLIEALSREDAVQRRRS